MRWVTDVSEGPEPVQKADAMVEAAAKLDLVANEFCNGVHGMLACTRIEVIAPVSILRMHLLRPRVVPSHHSLAPSWLLLICTHACTA